MKLFESDKIEFKTKWQDESCLETVSAFANTHGGRLFIGLDDQSNPVGSINTKKFLKDLTRFLIDRSGSSWDEYVVDDGNNNDIDLNTIKKFKLHASARLSIADSKISLDHLLEKLNLVTDKKLKRAALLLFGINFFSGYIDRRYH